MTADVGANPLTVAVLAQKLADLEKRFAEAEKRHNISDNPTPVPSPELPAAADEQVQATRAKVDSPLLSPLFRCSCPV